MAMVALMVLDAVALIIGALHCVSAALMPPLPRMAVAAAVAAIAVLLVAGGDGYLPSSGHFAAWASPPLWLLSAVAREVGAYIRPLFRSP